MPGLPRPQLDPGHRPGPEPAAPDPASDLDPAPEPAAREADAVGRDGFRVGALPLGLCAAGALAAVVAVTLVPAWRDQFALSATRRPETFTALALAQPEPDRTCALARAHGLLTLTVENRLGRATAYRYQVDVVPASGPGTTVQGQVDVAQGDTAPIDVAVPPATVGVGARISVRLLGRDEQLHLTCPPVRPAGPR